MRDLGDFLLRRTPRRPLKALAIPLGHELKTGEAHRHESARMLANAFAFLHNEGIVGDYAEFGVLTGRTFVEAIHASERIGRSMTFHAYDSFEGLPGTEGPFQQGDFKARKQEFDDRLRKHAAPQSVSVVVGWFDETLKTQPHYPVAIAWIDCDLYRSTVSVLDFLTDRLVDGAVLVFDDWFCHKAKPDRGEQRACAEWLDCHPEIELIPYRTFHWAGQSFIVNRNDGTAG